MCSMVLAAAAPEIDDLSSNWIDPNAPVSSHIPEQLGGNQVG